jgi:hypothetical protein
LHPMYNSLYTRKRKSERKSKQLLEAERKHSKWLLAQGLNGVKTAPPPKTYATANDLKVQNDKPIHTMGTPCYRKQVFKTTKTYTIAPAYNKGAYQVISKREVKNIGK